MTRVVHVGKDRFERYVGRRTRRFPKGSEWGNPFRIGEPHPETGQPLERGEAVSLYEEWMLIGEGQRLLRRLGELEGAVLGCFCAPKGGVTERDPLVCHGQVLLRLLVRRGEKTYREGQRRYVFSGSRGWGRRGPIRRALSGLPEGAIVVTGGVRGADRIAELEASRLGLTVEVYEADWDKHGKRAGFLRNEAMMGLPGVEACARSGRPARATAPITR